MNRAEAALRQCSGGAPARAVQILDSWTLDDRRNFRAAYMAEDWTTVYRLCGLFHEMNHTYSAKLFVHLLDATGEDPTERREIPDRRRKVLQGFFPERRRLPDRRKNLAS